jgi:putative acetyltransferase
MRCEPHEIDAVVSVLDTHIHLSRAEPGCLTFELWQDELDPCNFHMSEVFRSEEAFAKHQSRTQSSDWWRVTSHMPRDFTKSDA